MLARVFGLYIAVTYPPIYTFTYIFPSPRLLGSEGPAKVGRVAVLKYMYTNYAIGENAGCERRHIRVALDAATA